VDRGATWDNEWAAQKAAEALRYLGRHYPECLQAPRALDGPERAAHEAAVVEDREGFLQALRDYMRAGRAAALEIRRRAA
jgi:DNA-binding LacI/PurR family transcriptional regulator